MTLGTTLSKALATFAACEERRVSMDGLFLQSNYTWSDLRPVMLLSVEE